MNFRINSDIAISGLVATQKELKSINEKANIRMNSNIKTLDKIMLENQELSEVINRNIDVIVEIDKILGE